MAFSLRKAKKNTGSKENVSDEVGTSSPLSRLFKRGGSAQEELPTMDIQAGLHRALRQPNIQKKSDEDETKDIEAARDTLVSIEVALYAMDKVREIIDQCVEIANSAKLSEEAGTRALLAESYDDLRLSIDEIAEETDSPGRILIGAEAENIDLEMTGRARYSVACFRIDTSAGALDLPPPLNAFAESEEIDATLKQLQLAQLRVERATAAYCRDAKFLMARIGNKASDVPNSSLPNTIATATG